LSGPVARRPRGKRHGQSPRPLPFSRRLCRLAAQQRHQHGSERELTCPCLRGQNAQITAGAFDFIAALQDRGDDDRCIVFAHGFLRLRPSVRRNPERGSDQRRCCRQIPPIVDPALGVVDDVGTSLEHHAERVSSERGRVWIDGRRWSERALVVGPERFAPAFSKGRFKIGRICNLILYVPLKLGLIGASFLVIYMIFQGVLDFGVEAGKIARQSLQIGPQNVAREAAGQVHIAEQQRSSSRCPAAAK